MTKTTQRKPSKPARRSRTADGWEALEEWLRRHLREARQWRAMWRRWHYERGEANWNGRWTALEQVRRRIRRLRRAHPNTKLSDDR